METGTARQALSSLCSRPGSNHNIFNEMVNRNGKRINCLNTFDAGLQGTRGTSHYWPSVEGRMAAVFHLVITCIKTTAETLQHWHESKRLNLVSRQDPQFLQEKGFGLQDMIWTISAGGRGAGLGESREAEPYTSARGCKLYWATGREIQ